LKHYREEVASLVSTKLTKPDFSVTLGYRRKHELSGSFKNESTRTNQLKLVKQLLHTYLASEPESDSESEEEEPVSASK